MVAFEGGRNAEGSAWVTMMLWHHHSASALVRKCECQLRRQVQGSARKHGEHAELPAATAAVFVVSSKRKDTDTNVPLDQSSTQTCAMVHSFFLLFHDNIFIHESCSFRALHEVPPPPRPPSRTPGLPPPSPNHCPYPRSASWLTQISYLP